jgi:rhomboid protease GluP
VIEELRRSPATLSLAILWVAIFAMMEARQGTFSRELNPFAFGSVGVTTTHQFGDSTSAELAAGQIWRAITSTFVHYSVLHLVLNLFGLLELGLLAEHWYGSPQFLAIYIAIGGFGNLLAGYARPYFGIPDYAHCGGGSTVVFGLIGLCAVVGWRSRTKEGRDLGFWMVIFLFFNIAMGFALWLFNGMMGLGLPNFDHLAHITGTLMGVGIGFLDRPLRRMAWHPAAQRIGIVSGLVLIASMAAQSETNRAEIRAADERALAQDRWQSAGLGIRTLVDLDLLYRMSYSSGASPGSRAMLVKGVRGYLTIPISSRSEVADRIKLDVRQLELLQQLLGTGPTAADFDRVVQLAEEAAAAPPTKIQFERFEASLRKVYERAEQEYRQGLATLTKLTQQARKR